MFLGVFNFLADRFANISVNIQNVNAIANVDFFIMRKFKCLQFFYCWVCAIYSINTLLIIIAASILNLFLPFIGQLICVVIISYRFGVTYMAVSGFHYRQTLMQTRERAYRNFALTLGYGLTIYVIFLIPLAIVFTLPGLIIGGILILSEFLRNER